MGVSDQIVLRALAFLFLLGPPVSGLTLLSDLWMCENMKLECPEYLKGGGSGLLGAFLFFVNILCLPIGGLLAAILALSKGLAINLLGAFFAGLAVAFLFTAWQSILIMLACVALPRSLAMFVRDVARS